MTDEARIAVLEQQVLELRQKMKMVSDWHDTLNTHFYKRIWFWMQGYKRLSLGTWYSAPWNRAAGKKYNGAL